MSIIARIFVVIGVFATVAGIVAAIASVYDNFENLERKINNLEDDLKNYKEHLDLTTEIIDENLFDPKTGHSDINKGLYEKVEYLQERLDQLEAVYEPEDVYALDQLREKVYDNDHDLNGVSGLKFQITFLENRFNSLSGFTHQVLYGKCNNLIEDLTFTKNEYDRRLEWIFNNVLTQKQKDKYNEEVNND